MPLTGFDPSFFDAVIRQSRGPISDFMESTRGPLTGNSFAAPPLQGGDYNPYMRGLSADYAPYQFRTSTPATGGISQSFDRALNPSKYNADGTPKAAQQRIAQNAVQTGVKDTEARMSFSPNVASTAMAIIDYAANKYGASAIPVVAAVLKAEGGLTGDVGDTNLSPTGSHGPFQFYGPGGQLDAFAQAMGLSLPAAGLRARTDPVEAGRWALDNYFGNALAQGIAQGHSGEDLLRDVLRVQNPGALSSPGHFGRYQAALNEAQSGLNRPLIGGGFQQAPGMWPSAPLQGISQYDLGLPKDIADAFCGPTAALEAARAAGRNITVLEAMNAAKEVGWNQQRGMAGPQSQVNLMNRLGIPAYMEAPNENKIAQEVMAGRPVIIDTPGHYYQVTGYNQATNTFTFGDAVGQRAGNVGVALSDLSRFGFGAARTAIYLAGP